MQQKKTKKERKLNLREQRTLEKSENSREVVSREMMCFKIMKLVYNDSI